MAVFAMEAASIISERSLEISFASALSTVSSSGVNVNAGQPLVACSTFFLTQLHALRHGNVLVTLPTVWLAQMHAALVPRCDSSLSLFTVTFAGGKG